MGSEYIELSTDDAKMQPNIVNIGSSGPSPPPPPYTPPSTSEALKRVLRSRIVDQKDSVARDQLANERTFLAWIRTGFAISALGIVLARLHLSGSTTDHAVFTKILSLVFVVIGMLCIVVGSLRYAHVQILLEDDKFPTGGLAVTLVAILGLGAFLATFILLVL